MADVARTSVPRAAARWAGADREGVRAPQERPVRRLAVQGLTVICILVATGVVAALLHARDGREIADLRTERAERSYAVVRDLTQSSLSNLEQIAVTLGALRRPLDGRLRSFTRGAMHERSLSGVGYVLHVAGSDRGAFERSHGFRISVPGTGQPAPRRAAYDVLTAAVARPGDNPQAAIGADYSAVPSEAALFRRAVGSGRPQASSPRRSPFSGRPVVVVMAPVFRADRPTRTPAERRHALRGFIAGMYSTTELMAAVDRALPAGTQVQVSSDGMALAGSAPPEHDDWVGDLPVAGRQWTVHVASRSGDLGPWEWVVGILGAGLAALAASAFALDARRERRALGLVGDRMAERDAADAQLRRERDWSKAVIGSIQDGFAVTEGPTIVHVNDRLCELTGFSREELVGTAPPFPFWPVEKIEELEATIARFRREGTLEAEVTFCRRDGDRFPVLLTAGTVPGPDGAVRGTITTVKDISERKRYEERLAQLAAEDPLTGLLNHRSFHERLAEEVARTERTQRPLALVLLDLDHFKQVNDTLGHPVGDKVLVEVAARLRDVTRAGEHLARVGGEEFAWLLPEADAAGAVAAAERAREAIRATPFALGGTLTISAGVCTLAEAGGESRELYRLADTALYRAKAAGRDRVVPFGPMPAVAS
jgi:diguanylate cyclase (GGDEF)-like protein/PAS domain S-box-containing protein